MGPLRIKYVEPIPLYRLQIVWSDKRRRQHDIKEYICEQPYFEPLRENLDLFRTVQIDDYGTRIFWGSRDLMMWADTLLLPQNCVDMEVLTNNQYYGLT